VTATLRVTRRRFRALGTSIDVVVRDESVLEVAVDAVAREVSACDAACSRFRADSELQAVNGANGVAQPVSPWLFEALRVALRAAELTGGLVDPTLGGALRALGYDRDFAAVIPDGPALTIRLRTPSRWEHIELDTQFQTVCVPAGVELDLGATAKALCADRAAAAAHGATDDGVLVSMGGDIAVAGDPPPEGWVVRVGDDHRDPQFDDGAGAVRDAAAPAPIDDQIEDDNVAIRSGGMATSGTTVRRWRRGGVVQHHVLDPRTGRPAADAWRTVTVAAGSCVDANTASTASIILAGAAPAWLAEQGLPARLVAPDGTVRTTAGWPGVRTSGARRLMTPC